MTQKKKILVVDGSKSLDLFRGALWQHLMGPLRSNPIADEVYFLYSDYHTKAGFSAGASSKGDLGPTCDSAKALIADIKKENGDAEFEIVFMTNAEYTPYGYKLDPVSEVLNQYAGKLTTIGLFNVWRANHSLEDMENNYKKIKTDFYVVKDDIGPKLFDMVRDIFAGKPIKQSVNHKFNLYAEKVSASISSFEMAQHRLNTENITDAQREKIARETEVELDHLQRSLSNLYLKNVRFRLNKP